MFTLRHDLNIRLFIISLIPICVTVHYHAIFVVEKLQLFISTAIIFMSLISIVKRNAHLLHNSSQTMETLRIPVNFMAAGGCLSFRINLSVLCVRMQFELI